MNRLNRMTGLVSVIIGLFCACQGTAKQVDVETDLKAMYAARHRASRFSRLSGKYL